MKKTKNKLKKKLTKKFRLVVLNESSFEERFSFKLTRLNVFVFGGLFSILLIGITVFIIAFTPIKEYIPGYSSTKLKRKAATMFYKVDSMMVELNTLTKFTEGIRPILIGRDTIVDEVLPYKQLNLDKNKSVKFLENNDSITVLIANVRKEMDSSYKAYYKNKTDLMQKKHQEFQVSSQDLQEKNLSELKNNFVSKIDKQEDSIQGLNLNLSSFNKEISELKKQIALKEIESDQYMQSLSKEKQSKLLLKNKSIEKERKEVAEILQREYRINEDKLREAHQKELSVLNLSLFDNKVMIDSLTFELVQQQQKKIGELADEKPFKLVDANSEKLLVRSSKDSIFREDVEREDRFSLFDFETNDNKELVFFAPVKGIITDGYSIKDKHYAVDVAVKKGTGVKAIAEGTIVLAEWTLETGYVVIIEHDNEYLSVYKHNEILYRNQGDMVKSGEVISMAGSTGEYSTGPHLHFEMWYKGYSVNPINFIEFE